MSESIGDSSRAVCLSTFVIKNEIRKMQETLLIKGHYRGKVDGVFGLRDPGQHSRVSES